MGVWSYLNMFHDTDWPFECHLIDEEEVAIAREGGLRHRRVNKIVPHECFSRCCNVSTI